MQNDPFADFKAAQREGWGLFAPLEVLTIPAAGSLVAFAGVGPGSAVLDVACGTGVVAVTAARTGARVSGLDPSPPLLERARRNATVAGVDIDFHEGDVEALPFADGSFDFVLSQFGHMFAPRPAVAVAELLRVLKTGGILAFSTWPPELFTGQMFSLISRHVPPPPGVAPSPQWGDPAVVRERLGAAVTELSFEREMLTSPSLSPSHFRELMESAAAPLRKLIATLADEPARLAGFRHELEALIASYTKGTVLRQHFLMSRAKKR